MGQLRTLLTIIILFLCNDTLADVNDSRYWYGGVGLGQSRLQPETSDTGFSVADDQDTAAHLLLGYRFHKHFQTELFYVDLGVAGIEPNGEIGYRLSGATVIYNWPADNSRRSGWRLLLKTGLASLDNQSGLTFQRENEVQALAGISVDYRLSRRWLIRSGYERFSEDAQWLSLNMIWEFGRQRIKTAGINASSAAEQNLQRDSDQDQDGVKDIQDRCSNTPSGVPVNAVGCSVFQGVLPNIQFESNASVLTPAGRQSLQIIAKALLDYPNIFIEVQAHTDSKGKSEYNLWLSDRRARSVVAYLIELGVDAKKLRPVGYGETQPVANNDTKSGRANNRRVEFHITSMD